MRIPSAAVAGLALALMLPAAAEAMPAAQPIPLAGTEAPPITLTAGGCGFGFHRNFYGFCRPNFYGGGWGWHHWGWHHWGWHRHWGWHHHWGWHRHW